MTTAARVLAVVLGMIGLLVAVAALVREVALAADPSLVWPQAGWWTRLTAQPSWATTAAAAGTVAAAVVLFVLAAGQVRGRRRHSGHVEFGAEHGQARLDLGALEAALARRAKTELPGVQASRVTLRSEGGSVRIRLEARVRARDLLGLQARAAAVLGADLTGLGGLRLAGLDLVVTGVVNGAGGAAAAPKKEDLGMTRSS